jgi:hypothetical protein
MDDENTPKTLSKALTDCNFSGSKYGVQERIQVAVAFLIHGNVSRTSEATGIPKTTIRDWRNTDWWGPLNEEVRAEKESEFQAGFTRIVESAIGQIEDRLQHGDVKLVKIGNEHEQRRVPVSAKDATMVAAISYDKLRLSLNLPTSIRAVSDNDLENLGRKFEEIGKKYQHEVIDVTPFADK